VPVDGLEVSRHGHGVLIVLSRVLSDLFVFDSKLEVACALRFSTADEQNSTQHRRKLLPLLLYAK
jgi:hypothetical protein